MHSGRGGWPLASQGLTDQGKGQNAGLSLELRIGMPSLLDLGVLFPKFEVHTCLVDAAK